MKITLVNASPKKRGSFSNYILNELIPLVKTEREPELLSMSLWDDDFFDDLCSSDALVFAFPLYVDSLPASFLRFLTHFEERLKNSPADIRVYGLVNSGFLEGHQNRFALEILAHFCRRAKLTWCGGLGIGGGPFLHGMAAAPWKFSAKRPVYDGLVQLSEAVKNGQMLEKDLLVTPKIPKKIYIAAANHQWVTEAKKNGLKKKELYKK
ncbi:hypothetical protein [Eubacterium sp. 1001713B170207_170306_E7]|uniref:hypothetical protein n=1 Tax=Eubacterium sp. 1001713B170207_170306_E7 TaxID=2787097 RepID=UPI001899781A|nr:hypothetical protein [Eubacterium sp. 1001713B170207_170306_E7]